MQRPKSIEEINSVYELGYYTFLKYNGQLPLTLMASIKSIIKKASNKKQRYLLGGNAYLDYKKYSEQIKYGDFSNFNGLLDYIFPGMFNLEQKKEASLLEYLVKEDEISTEDLICAKIAKDYFSIKEFKKFLYGKNFQSRKN
jgi:hypothetical protein